MSQNLENIAVSIMSKVDNDGTVSTISFPPTIETRTHNENIRYAVFRSMNYSSKYNTICELTNKQYPEDELLFTKLKSADYIKNHHCAGNIIYHPENEQYLDDAHLYFECQEKMMLNHSLQGKEINIERSNGNIEKAIIVKDSCFLYNNNYKSMSVYVCFKNKDDDEDYYKWVLLEDCISNSTKKYRKGVYNLNKELFDEGIIFYVKEHPEWMDVERKHLFEFIKENLDKLSINCTFHNNSDNLGQDL